MKKSIVGKYDYKKDTQIYSIRKKYYMKQIPDKNPLNIPMEESIRKMRQQEQATLRAIELMNQLKEEIILKSRQIAKIEAQKYYQELILPLIKNGLNQFQAQLLVNLESWKVKQEHLMTTKLLEVLETEFSKFLADLKKG